MRVCGQHPIAHGDQVGRAPDRPPAPGPVADAPARRAVRLEGAQDLHRAIHPKWRTAIDGVCKDSYRGLATGDCAGPREVTPKTTTMTEPVPAIRPAHAHAQSVIGLKTLRDAPLA